ncbi:MAG TPA: signal recognition particle receptor subunit alpha, partial [Chitinophagaceae bacterium]|nr:signal recognition particle receptor subunit alpha [Chitinophagaceae bacterium]
MGFFNKLFGKKEKETLNDGLQKTKEGFFTKLTKAIAGKSTVDAEVLDNLEEALIGADVGVETTLQIIEGIEKRVKEEKYISTAELNKVLQNEIQKMLTDANDDAYRNFEIPTNKKPYIILV